MKIVDRYVLTTFLKNYLISFLVLVGMYIVLDMIFNFDELVEYKDKAELVGPSGVITLVTYVADYYFYQVFNYFVLLSGIIPVVAATFTLMRMVRFNELSALLSAGVPLLRLARPIVIASVILQGLLLLDQELIIPNIIPQLARKHDHAYEADKKAYAIQAMRADGNGKLWAGLYWPNATPPKIEFLDVVYQDEQSRPVRHLKADGAVWDAVSQHWKLTNGRIDSNIFPDARKIRGVKSEPVEAFASGVNPTELALYRSGDFVEMLSTGRIEALLQRPLSYGRADLLRVKHVRWTQPVVNIIVLLLAISCVLTREPRQLKAAATNVVVLCGLCMGVSFLGQHFATQPPGDVPLNLWTALMAFVPIFTFGPAALVLLDRVKT